MNTEGKRFLRNLLENSTLGSTRDKLRELAEYMLSRKEFNSLLPKIEADNFKPSEVIFKLIEGWISYRGREATLENFEQILRDHDLNADAGT